MVAPERDTPGIRAAAWAHPIQKALFVPALRTGPLRGEERQCPNGQHRGGDLRRSQALLDPFTE